MFIREKIESLAGGCGRGVIARPGTLFALWLSAARVFYTQKAFRDHSLDNTKKQADGVRRCVRMRIENRVRVSALSEERML